MVGKEKNPIIYFAPLQEFTDWVYRKNHSKMFGAIDKYFAPYISCQNDGTVKKSHLKDILPENNAGYLLIPQILTGNPKHFIFLSKSLIDLGYKEINWNLGCPYPMVTNRGQGAGLLPYPDKIDQILSESLPQLTCKLSVKLRAGSLSAEEIFPVLTILNKYPLEEIILHPRIATQLYRGESDPEIFIKAAELTQIPLIYNGDLLTLDDYNCYRKRLLNQNKWMIGRGILKDPFLPSRIRKNPVFSSKVKLLQQFHSAVFFEYSKLLSGRSHLLMRMLKFWTYFCYSFPDPHKTLKKIKKSQSLDKYEIAVRENFIRLIDDEKN